MRIALLLYGQPRFADHPLIYQTIQREIFSKYYVDCFCHTWWDPDNLVFSSSSWSTIQGVKSYNGRTLDCIKNTYNPKVFSHQLPVDFTDLSSNFLPGSHIKTKQNAANVFSQLYSLQQVARSFNEFSNVNSLDYKFIILARYDTVTVNVPDLNYCNPANIYLCGTHTNFPDLIQIVGSLNFHWVLHVFDNATTAFAELPNPTPESIRQHAFNRYGLPASNICYTSMHSECIRSNSDAFYIPKLRLLGHQKLLNIFKQRLKRLI